MSVGYVCQFIESLRAVGRKYGSRLSDDSGYQKLHDQGFKTIVDLTAEGTDNKDAALKAGLQTMQVPTLDNSPPTIAQRC